MRCGIQSSSGTRRALAHDVIYERGHIRVCGLEIVGDGENETGGRCEGDQADIVSAIDELTYEIDGRLLHGAAGAASGERS